MANKRDFENSEEELKEAYNRLDEFKRKKEMNILYAAKITKVDNSNELDNLNNV